MLILVYDSLPKMESQREGFDLMDSDLSELHKFIYDFLDLSIYRFYFILEIMMD